MGEVIVCWVRLVPLVNLLESETRSIHLGNIFFCRTANRQCNNGLFCSLSNNHFWLFLSPSRLVWRPWTLAVSITLDSKYNYLS